MVQRNQQRFKPLKFTQLPGCCGVAVLHGFNANGTANRTLAEALANVTDQDRVSITETHGIGVATLDQKQYEKYGASLQIEGWKLVAVGNNPGDLVWKGGKRVRQTGNDIFLFVKGFQPPATTIGKQHAT